MQTQSSYISRYVQLQLLGRGNYGIILYLYIGSAYLVQSKTNQKKYVAKRMNLDGMNQQQLKSAKEQIQILKKFSGDLASFIKNAKKKGQLLQQEQILAWFVMLVMGIQALHSKNVLHRDLKSANIFLTSNKYVKIGDFGISKVLDHTSARTFVGTPYYLSPQICMNKSYDFKSDLWALGSTNILSLAMKITNQNIINIDKKYSQQLNNIVIGLLTKQKQKRMTLQQILAMPYMKKFMLQNCHRIDQICQKIPFKKNNKQMSKMQKKQQTFNFTVNQKQDTMKTINSNFQKTNNDSLNISLTHKQKIKLLKQQKILQQNQKIVRATRQNWAQMNQFAKTRKKQQFQGTYNNSKSYAKTLYQKYQKQNKQAAQQKYRKKHGLDVNQSINLQVLGKVLTNQTVNLNNRQKQIQCCQFFKNSLKQSNISKNLLININNQNEYKQIQKLQQQIQIQYKQNNQDQQLQQYYDEDFQQYNPDQQSQIRIKQDVQVFKNYIQFVSGKQDISPTKKRILQKTFQKQQILLKPRKQKYEQYVNKCKQKIGQSRYLQLYKLISKSYLNNGQYKQTNQLKQLRINGTDLQKQSLKLLDLIKFYQKQ